MIIQNREGNTSAREYIFEIFFTKKHGKANSIEKYAGIAINAKGINSQYLEISKVSGYTSQYKVDICSDRKNRKEFLIMFIFDLFDSCMKNQENAAMNSGNIFSGAKPKALITPAMQCFIKLLFIKNLYANQENLNTF